MSDNEKPFNVGKAYVNDADVDAVFTGGPDGEELLVCTISHNAPEGSAEEIAHALNSLPVVTEALVLCAAVLREIGALDGLPSAADWKKFQAASAKAAADLEEALVDG